MTGRADDEGLETSTIVIWLASGDVNARASRLVVSSFSDAKTGNPFNAAGPVVHPGENSLGQLVAQPVLAGLLVHDHDIEAAISVKIASTKKLLRRLIDESW